MSRVRRREPNLRDSRATKNDSPQLRAIPVGPGVTLVLNSETLLSALRAEVGTWADAEYRPPKTPQKTIGTRRKPKGYDVYAHSVGSVIDDNREEFDAVVADVLLERAVPRLADVVDAIAKAYVQDAALDVYAESARFVCHGSGLAVLWSRSRSEDTRAKRREIYDDAIAYLFPHERQPGREIEPHEINTLLAFMQIVDAWIQPMKEFLRAIPSSRRSLDVVLHRPPFSHLQPLYAEAFHSFGTDFVAGRLPPDYPREPKAMALLFAGRFMKKSGAWKDVPGYRTAQKTYREADDFDSRESS